LKQTKKKYEKSLHDLNIIIFLLKNSEDTFFAFTSGQKHCRLRQSKTLKEFVFENYSTIN
jgi:hypothetical protein